MEHIYRSPGCQGCFNSGAPISVVPLDAIQYLVQSKDIDRINTYKDPGVRYVAQMWNQQWGWGSQNGFLIWDTITAIAVTNPEYFKWTYDGVDVITDLGDFQGQTIPLHNGARHIRYATDADYDAILDQLFDVFSRETQRGCTRNPHHRTGRDLDRFYRAFPYHLLLE